MTVSVKRYKRNRVLSDKSSPELYYLKPENGSMKTANIKSIAREIETTGALSAEDVFHTMSAFVRQLRKSLTDGKKVKVDGLGTFFLTFNCTGSATEKECTVKNINKVNIRFLTDSTLRLVNDTTATTRGGENNVRFSIKGETADSTESGGGGNGGGGGGGVIDPNA